MPRPDHQRQGHCKCYASRSFRCQSVTVCVCVCVCVGHRVQLREGDSLFFVKNMVESWLPIPYELSGVAADTHTNRYATTAARAAAANGRLLPASNGSANGSVGGYSSSNGAGSSGGVSGTTSEEGLGAGPRPLENESWWRMVSV